MPNVRAREDKDEEAVGVNKKRRKEEEDNIIEGQNSSSSNELPKEMTQLILIQILKKIQQQTRHHKNINISHKDE